MPESSETGETWGCLAHAPEVGESKAGQSSTVAIAGQHPSQEIH